MGIWFRGLVLVLASGCDLSIGIFSMVLNWDLLVFGCDRSIGIFTMVLNWDFWRLFFASKLFRVCCVPL